MSLESIEESSFMNVHQCFPLITRYFKVSYNFLYPEKNDFVFSNYMIRSVCKSWYSSVKIDVPAPPIKTMEHFARTGNLNILKWFHKQGLDISLIPEVCIEASKFGHIEILKWAFANGSMKTKEMCRNAASKGHLEILNFLRTNACPWDEQTCAEAAGNNHYNIVLWCREMKCPWDKKTLSNIANYGNIEHIISLRNMGCPWDAATFSNAAKRCSLVELQRLKQCKFPWDEQVAIELVYFSRPIEYLLWAISEKLPITIATFITAAYKGNFKVLQLLLQEMPNIERSTVVCNNAAKGGQIECLKYLISLGFPCCEQTCTFAVMGGHFDILQYLRKMNCPWNAGTCTEAAYRGYFKILKWARENGCPWNGSTTLAAARSGHWDIYNCLVDNQCAVDVRAILHFVKRGDTHWTCFQAEQDYTWMYVTQVAAYYGHVHILKIMRTKYGLNDCLFYFALDGRQIYTAHWLQKMGIRPLYYSVCFKIFKKSFKSFVATKTDKKKALINIYFQERAYEEYPIIFEHNHKIYAS